MAVQIFKDGQSKYIEPRSLKNHLEQGWSVDDPDRPGLEIQYPNTEGLSPDEAEEKVLEEMGIEVVYPKKKTKKKRKKAKKKT